MRVALVVIGILLIVSLLVVAVASRPAAPLPLPERVAGHSLRAHVFGPEAAAEIRRMHRGTFPLTAAAIGVYGNGDAVLWVGQTWGRVGAWALERSMTATISRTESPFRPVRERDLNGVHVYELEGMGQRHFYFRVGDRIYWLAVSPEWADRALAEVIRFAGK